MQNFKSLLENYKVIFFDAYGVIKNYMGLIPGIEKTFEWLKQEKKDYYVITNDASRSPELLAEVYHDAGLKAITSDKIISSGMLAKEFLELKVGKGLVAYLGTAESAHYIEHPGLEVLPLQEMNEDNINDITALVLLDDEGFEWMDGLNNNRALLSQTICATLNGASIYIESLRNPDKYITEKGAQLKTDIQHAPLPKGPAGQFAMHTFFSHVIPNYSKNQAAAKEFLKWIHTQANYEPWFVSQKGFATPPTHVWEKHKLWDEDKVMAPFKVAGLLGQTPGYPLPSSGKKAAEVLTKYIITDMYAKAIQGGTAEDAVKWAEGELKKIYTPGA